MRQARWNALRACISEGRQPSSAEIDVVAATIWKEAGASPDASSWIALPINSDLHGRAIQMAELALRGSDETTR